MGRGMGEEKSLPIHFKKAGCLWMDIKAKDSAIRKWQTIINAAIRAQYAENPD